MVAEVVVVFVLTWAGSTLLIDALFASRAARKDLVERLRPFHQSVGDEAERWLKNR